MCTNFWRNRSEYKIINTFNLTLWRYELLLDVTGKIDIDNYEKYERERHRRLIDRSGDVLAFIIQRVGYEINHDHKSKSISSYAGKDINS